MIKIPILVEDWEKEILNSDKSSKCYRKACWWIKFTKTEKWVEKIYKMQQKKDICIEEKEKLMILEFVKYKKNLQNILETEKNNLKKKKNEGKIIKLYENL